MTENFMQKLKILKMLNSSHLTAAWTHSINLSTDHSFSKYCSSQLMSRRAQFLSHPKVKRTEQFQGGQTPPLQRAQQWCSNCSLLKQAWLLWEILTFPDLQISWVRGSVMKSILSVTLQWPPMSSSQTWTDEPPFIVVWADSNTTRAFGFFSWRYLCHWPFNLFWTWDKFLSIFKFMTKKCYVEMSFSDNSPAGAGHVSLPQRLRISRGLPKKVAESSRMSAPLAVWCYYFSTSRREIPLLSLFFLSEQSHLVKVIYTQMPSEQGEC